MGEDLKEKLKLYVRILAIEPRAGLPNTSADSHTGAVQKDSYAPCATGDDLAGTRSGRTSPSPR